MPDKARGWLVFSCLPKDLQDAEDSTQDVDFARGRELWLGSFRRDATEAGRTLLAHIGHTVPDAQEAPEPVAEGGGAPTRAKTTPRSRTAEESKATGKRDTGEGLARPVSTV